MLQNAYWLAMIGGDTAENARIWQLPALPRLGQEPGKELHQEVHIPNYESKRQNLHLQLQGTLTLFVEY